MSEGDKKPLSGTGAGERKPTIIGGGVQKGKEPLRPTTIAGGQKPTPGHGRPTPIFAPNATPKEVTKEQPPQPTVIKSITPAPAEARPHKVETPTSVFGTVRKGIKVEPEELAKLFPGNPSEILEEASEVLRGIISELLTDAMCVRWGEEKQRQFGKITQDSLTLMNAPVIQDGQRHLNRLYTILETLAEEIQGKDNDGFLFWKKTPNLKETFEANLPEMTQLRQMLETVLTKVVETWQEIESHVGELETLATEVDAYVISAQYLIGNSLEKDRTRAIHALETRSISLSETVVHIRQSAVHREQVRNDLHALIGKIQNCILNELPIWIENVAFCLKKSSQTETDLYTLRQGLEGILQQLK